MERNLITLVGRVSYLGRVKQGNYHAHVLYTIPNPNYTLPKPYPFIITYPIHHPTLGTKTGGVLPCASINTTLPWISTYPYPSIVILYSSTYPTLPTVGKIPLPTLSIYPTYPFQVTSAYILVPTSRYLLLHTQIYISLSYTITRACLNIMPKRPTKLGRNDPGPKRLWPKRPRPEGLRTEMTQG